MGFLKKKYCVFLVMLACGLGAPGQTTLRGDVNGDGTVDGLDLNEVINIILGHTPTTGIIEVDTLSRDMVRVAGGTFMMGCDAATDADAYYDEMPLREVTVSTFYISRYEVTQALWQAVMGNNPSQFVGPRRPVENVSWDDCQQFIARLNEITGLNYRLPTEAEWEYAARGGMLSHGYRYAGSDNIDDVAWYGSNSNSTHDVGTLQPNELGLYDMSGNVMEWVGDWYGIYDPEDLMDPQGAWGGTNKVFRGGAWPMIAMACRVAGRLCLSPSYRANQLGLRLVLPAK